MNKQEFLTRLRKKLSGLPHTDVEDRLVFYSEMIDDQIEEGLSESEAVLVIGSVDEIAAQIIADAPLSQPKREPQKVKKKLSISEIILLALGSPIWISLTVSAAAVILSLYISLWAVIISLWAAFGSLIVFALGIIAAAIVLICCGYGLTGTAILGAGIFCAGLSVFMFYGCKVVTKGILILTKKMAIWIKNCLIKKEDA